MKTYGYRVRENMAMLCVGGSTRIIVMYRTMRPDEVIPAQGRPLTNDELNEMILTVRPLDEVRGMHFNMHNAIAGAINMALSDK